MLILKLLRGTTVLIYKFATKQQTEHKLGVIFFVKINYKYGWACKKLQKNKAETKTQDYLATK